MNKAEVIERHARNLKSEVGTGLSTNECYQIIKSAVNEVLNLPCVTNWVACSEELPERRKRVLITDGKLVTEAHLNKRNNTWEGYMIVGVQEFGEPIWWAELPAPPCL